MRAVLIRAFPNPPTKPTATQQRYCTSLAKRVHAALQQLTGKKVDFPKIYDRAAQQKLIQAFRTVR